ncbi:MAG TPA: hypothetical protein VGJ06_12785 [Candidatus Acidoferrum sp.]|jgi:hypothetical protein
MAKKKIAPKKSKKQKPAAKKAAVKKSASKSVAVKAKTAVAKRKPAPKAKAKASAPAKAKAVAKGKSAAKKKIVAKTKTVAKARTAPRRGASDSDTDIRGNQEVETVRLKQKSRVARAGTGAGDLQGISTVEDVDSESADELLEEGQSFEAGIVSGVERAGNETSEVVTHEVLEDDVPLEYDDEDRP